jgi:hypothetical protein
MARTTKRRRSTKHRGNAAGGIEARGRTGRKPTAAEKGRATGKGSKGGRSSAAPRPKRFESPPTWKSAAVRAVLAAIVVYAVSTVLLHKKPATNLPLLPVVLLLYAPMIYYTDLMMYKRYIRKRSAG